jgi:hypothetical protein
MSSGRIISQMLCFLQSWEIDWVFFYFLKLHQKIRIAYIAWTEPGSVSGATLAIQRHLYEGGEFEVLVCTDKPYRGVGKAENWIQFTRPWIQHRLSRTRLRRLVSQYEMLWEPYFAARRFLPKVQKFQPDLILTIPDNSLSWAGYLIAKKSKLLLVTNFQDWWPVIFAPHEAPFTPVRRTLEKRFRLLYKSSAVAFCTSEGFKKFLGPHPDAPVLYPCPASRPKERPLAKTPSGEKPLRVVYGGTLVRYYGQMMLSLARALESSKEFELRLFGGRPDWSAVDLDWAIGKRIYCGQLSPEDYRKELLTADIFITAMSDDPEVETMMRTSFTTKFLEYCQFAKPVIVWGPQYCEPIRVARFEGCALAVVARDSFSVIEALKTLKNPETYRKFSDAAWRAATTFFDPETIQKIFQDGVQRALSKNVLDNDSL